MGMFQLGKESKTCLCIEQLLAPPPSPFFLIIGLFSASPCAHSISGRK